MIPTLDELYSQNHYRVLSYILRMVRNQEWAEDLTHAVFVKAFRKIDGFRGESSFSTWIHSFARNEVREWRRRENRLPQESLDIPGRKELQTPDRFFQLTEQRECCARLKRVLMKLPGKQRSVLIDHFVRGLSIRRIAKKRKVPSGTVLSRIFKAKRNLLRVWEQSVNREKARKSLGGIHEMSFEQDVHPSGGDATRTAERIERRLALAV